MTMTGGQELTASVIGSIVGAFGAKDRATVTPVAQASVSWGVTDIIMLAACVVGVFLFLRSR